MPAVILFDESSDRRTWLMNIVSHLVESQGSRYRAALLKFTYDVSMVKEAISFCVSNHTSTLALETGFRVLGVTSIASMTISGTLNLIPAFYVRVTDLRE